MKAINGKLFTGIIFLQFIKATKVTNVNFVEKFSQAGYLKKHIYTNHQGRKDCKFESCGKSCCKQFSLHILEGNKD